MAQPKSLSFSTNGRNFQIFLNKYCDECISPTDFHSDEIRDDILLLPSNQTFGDFKFQQRQLLQASQSGLRFPAWLSHASSSEFGKSYACAWHLKCDD